MKIILAICTLLSLSFADSIKVLKKQAEEMNICLVELLKHLLFMITSGER